MCGCWTKFKHARSSQRHKGYNFKSGNYTSYTKNNLIFLFLNNELIIYFGTNQIQKKRKGNKMELGASGRMLTTISEVQEEIKSETEPEVPESDTNVAGDDNKINSGIEQCLEEIKSPRPRPVLIVIYNLIQSVIFVNISLNFIFTHTIYI